MFKKLAISGIGFALLATPVFASALSADKLAKIDALLAQIKELKALIVQLQGTSSTSCVDLSANLTLGASSDDVTSLQNYLIAKNYLDAQYNTGYYGFITAQAVGKLQISLGIVSSQSDAAYGIMGPKTRAAIACEDNSVLHKNISFTASQVPATLQVIFHSGSLTGGTINFGDGTSGAIRTAACGDNSGGCSYGAIHTYSAPATYTATLKDSSGNALGTATLTVIGSTTASTPTITGITPSSGPAYTDVKISGVGFEKGDIIKFNGSSVTTPDYSTYSSSDGSLTFTIPDAEEGCLTNTGHVCLGIRIKPGTYDVSVTNPQGQTSNTLSFTVTGSNSAQPSPYGGTPVSPNITCPVGTSYQKACPTNAGSCTLGCYSTSVPSQGSNSSQPSATIDQNSLTAHDVIPTISGTASNTNSVNISLFDSNGAKVFGSQGGVAVVNGKWSTTVYRGHGDALGTGTFTANIDDASGNLLATGTLTVSGL